MKKSPKEGRQTENYYCKSEYSSYILETQVIRQKPILEQFINKLQKILRSIVKIVI